MQINGLNFVMTCGACPEQYDVFRGENEVGYVRLRWGHLSCDAPYGTTVFDAQIDEGGWRGLFESPEEREKWLTKCAKEINSAMEN